MKGIRTHLALAETLDRSLDEVYCGSSPGNCCAAERSSVFLHTLTFGTARVRSVRSIRNLRSTKI